MYLSELEERATNLEKRNSELEEKLSTLQNENQMLRHVRQTKPSPLALFVNIFVHDGSNIDPKASTSSILVLMPLASIVVNIYVLNLRT